MGPTRRQNKRGILIGKKRVYTKCMINLNETINCSHWYYCKFEITCQASLSARNRTTTMCIHNSNAFVILLLNLFIQNRFWPFCITGNGVMTLYWSNEPYSFWPYSSSIASNMASQYYNNLQGTIYGICTHKHWTQHRYLIINFCEFSNAVKVHVQSCCIISVQKCFEYCVVSIPGSKGSKIVLSCNIDQTTLTMLQSAACVGMCILVQRQHIDVCLPSPDYFQCCNCGFVIKHVKTANNSIQ